MILCTRRATGLSMLIVASVWPSSSAFIVVPIAAPHLSPTTRRRQQVMPSCNYRRPAALLQASQYVPPAQPEDTPSSTTKPNNKKQYLYPKVGDTVVYYDLDGGIADGQVLVGKISFIQRKQSNSMMGAAAAGDEEGSSGWLVELAELDDLGDGYYAEYPFRKRASKKALRDLTAVSPISASFVGTENAWKIPCDADTGRPISRAERYDIEGYEGPFADVEIDQAVIEQDYEIYASLKGMLLRYAAIAGVAGTLIANLVGGTENALIYGAGVVGALLYLRLLYVKTDTVALEDSRFGKKLSNLRFVMPLLVLSSIALYNRSLGDANPVQGRGVFESITPQQYAAAVLGFLTYRIPLFVLQVQNALKGESGDLQLPGSAGIAMQLAEGAAEGVSTSEASVVGAGSLVTLFLVSGPQATGRPELVKRFIELGEGRYVEPKRVDRVSDGATFERLEQREEFLTVDPSGRYGTTKDGILKAARECGSNSVVVVDANIDVAKELAKIPGVRLVAVWVGLNSMEEFEKRLEAQIDSGEIQIPADESRESVVRARLREIVLEIEYGISSGIFEFTILNQDEEESLKQLRDAVAYCFK